MEAVFFQLYQIFFRPFRGNFLVPLEGTFQILQKELFRPFRRNVLETLQKGFLRPCKPFRTNFFDLLEGNFQTLQKEPWSFKFFGPSSQEIVLCLFFIIISHFCYINNVNAILFQFITFYYINNVNAILKIDYVFLFFLTLAGLLLKTLKNF